jgi:hypothetical protein
VGAHVSLANLECARGAVLQASHKLLNAWP